MLDWFGSFRRRLSSRHWTAIAILLVVVVTTYRHFALIHYHAVNLLYWDQWGFFDPLFIGKRWWELFRWQHGPWRQGAGILSYWLAELTRWDSRAESFFIGVLVWLAMAAALWLKRRLFGKLVIYDIAIPLIILTPTQFQTYTGAVSSAPTTFPLLLIVLYCLTWTIESKRWRYGLALAFNFLLVNTGYGLFIGGVTLMLFAIECWRSRNQRNEMIAAAIGMLVSILTIIGFVVDYNLEHFNGSIRQSVTHLWDYPLFAALMLGRFVRPYPNQIAWFTYLAMLCGIGLLLLATAALVFHLRKTSHQTESNCRLHWVVTILLGFELLFLANAAWGRAGMGLNGSQSSRFVTLLIPGILGLYFHLLTVKSDSLRRVSLIGFLLLMLPGHLPLRLGDSHPASVFSRGKTAWKACFLQTGDVRQCNQLTKFAAVAAIESDVFRRRIEFLKQHRLNLYKDASPTP